MSQMDVEIPSWLDESFLSDALQGGKDRTPRVSVTGFSVHPAIPAGANYISLLFRVGVNYKVDSKEKMTSLIVKAPITSGVVKEITDECDHYFMETSMYNKVLPILNNLLRYSFSPKSFYSSVKDVLILEDLKHKGYKMGDRHKQLDFNHCKIVLTTLAKFHAASVACKRDHPDLIREVSKESLYSNNSMFETKIKPWIEESLEAIVEVISEMELGKDVDELFQKRVKNCADIMLEHCSPKKNGFNVLVHGDVSVNNLLFKYSSLGGIEDVKLIDFQLRRYSSPMMDLMYFIWTSADEDVRGTKLPQLFELYRQTLNTTLEQLGCEERLPEEEFRQDIKEAADLAIVIVGHITPIIVSDAETLSRGGQTNDSFLDSFGGKQHLFHGKYLKALLPKMTQHLLSWVKHYS